MFIKYHTALRHEMINSPVFKIHNYLQLPAHNKTSSGPVNELRQEFDKLIPNSFTNQEIKIGIEKFIEPDDDFMYSFLFKRLEQKDDELLHNELLVNVTEYFTTFKQIRRLLLETDKQCFGDTRNVDKIGSSVIGSVSIETVFPKDLCYCRNGQVQTDVSFKKYLLDHCPLRTESCHSQKCDKGYYHKIYAPPKPHGVCKLKKCRCPYGEGNQGLDCPIDGGYSCKSCEEDYRKVILEKRGTGFSSICQSAESKSCEVNNIPIGYHMDPKDNLCHLNNCTCEFGEAAVFKDCPVDGETRCQKFGCQPFYHRENRICVPNKCTCQIGEPVKDADCTEHGAVQCMDECDDGFISTKYKVIKEKRFNFLQANQYCQNQGMSMARIRSEEDNKLAGLRGHIS